jgi:hypothetical protein
MGIAEHARARTVRQNRKKDELVNTLGGFTANQTPQQNAGANTANNNTARETGLRPGGTLKPTTQRQAVASRADL